MSIVIVVVVVVVVDIVIVPVQRNIITTSVQFMDDACMLIGIVIEFFLCV